MLTFLGLIVAMILIGMFWRIILPVAVLGVLGIGAVILLGAGIVAYENSQVKETKVVSPIVERCWATYKDEVGAQQFTDVANCVLAAKKATN